MAESEKSGTQESATLTRRGFVAVSALGGAAIAIGCNSGAPSSWEFFNYAQARTLAVLCDQIIPADDFPSASQAGAVNYIDRQLVRHYKPHRETYRQGLERAELLSQTRIGKSLDALGPKQQLAIVTEIAEQDKAFFELVRAHTLEGYYGSPRHGGNRDAVSWRMLGLDDPPLEGREQAGLAQASPGQYDPKKGSPA